MFLGGINKNALLCKKLKDVPFQSFSKYSLLSPLVAYSAKYSLLSPLVTYSGPSSRKISKESFQWIRRTRCITFCAQFRVKMPYFWVNRSRLSIFIIVTFVYLYSPTSCKISEKSLIWIPRTRCLRSFWPLGIKISHLETKKSFLIIFTILASTIHRKSQVKSHVIHYFHLSFCKNSKKPLEWIPRKRKQAFWAQIDPW